jgi:phosphatidylglycerophosphate synthase
MIDARLLPLQRRLTHPPAALLYRLGVPPDYITLTGFALGVLAFIAIALQAYLLGLALLALNRIADGLDGAVARLGTPTDRGAFLDIALDFVFYALVPLGFALADPGANALPAAILIFSFVGSGSSFLAFSVLAEKRGLDARNYPTKAIYYLGGLTEGFETIMFFVAFCLWPQAFPILAYIFAVAALITTVTRWMIGWQVFAPERSAKP